VLTPTSTREVARQMVRLAGTDRYGVFHATARGQCSWYEFAAEIFRLAGIGVRLNVAGPDESPMEVPRPKYSVLENGALRDAGLDVFRPWQIALAEYLDVAVPA
jgi:dTDP-4-dehydrorhamnose reductase